jgi:hypothetical protein
MKYLAIDKKFLGVLISIVFVVIIFAKIDMKEFIQAFYRINPFYILPIIPVYFFSFVFRSFRWRVLLGDKTLRFGSLLSSLFIGFGLNCLLPARAGEIYRAYNFSKKEKICLTKIFTSIILERIFDGVMLFIMLISGMILVYSGGVLPRIALSSGLIFIGGFMFLFTLVKFRKTGNKREAAKSLLFKIFSEKTIFFGFRKPAEEIIEKIFIILNSFMEGLGVFNSIFPFLKVLFLTLIIWIIEGTCVYFMIIGFGIKLPYFAAFFVLSVVAFATLIPAGPGGFGPFQCGYIIALKIFGVAKVIALALAIFSQVFIMLIVVPLAFLYFIKEQGTIKEIKETLNHENHSEDCSSS